MTKTYAGIGARKTPDNIQIHMTSAAVQLSTCGFTLRSGGADGADSAFELGAPKDKKEIFLPWNNFNGRKLSEPGVIVPTTPLWEAALKLAKQYHPVWDKLSGSTKSFMARNAFQVLGPDLNDPVSFVLCWTPNGRTEGGTGQAIRMATGMNIPVFNMGKMSLEEIQTQINNLIN